ncbi:MAG: hypothetical protein GFH25_541182n15 [Chloroflexi bacterium AL-N10]|nr:hypothetical protein [Chloroflexi bacterium AL-N10]
MQTVKIELETVTPLFLSGATQQEPELRVPALLRAPALSSASSISQSGAYHHSNIKVYV